MLNFAMYMDAIARANHLTPPCPEWVFYPGMLQDSNSMWWGDFGTRHACHEGIDICFYKKSDADIQALMPGARIPAMASGTVLNISKDLMGTSIAVSLDTAETDIGDQNTHDTDTPILVYAHIVPEPGIHPGKRIAQGDLFAKTFDARTIQSRLRSHLHISCLLIPAGMKKNELNWRLFADRTRVAYINPVFL